MKIHEYPKEDLVVTWQPELCKHAGVCVKMLPNVYRPKDRPWIHQENATSQELREQIDACPSGALGYFEK